MKKVGLSSFVLFALIFSLTFSVAWAKELTFLTVGYSGELLNYLRNEVVPEFKDKYGVDVVMLSANWDTRMERIIVLTAGGTPPDVVCTGAYSPYEEGSVGMLEPLDRYLCPVALDVPVFQRAMGFLELARPGLRGAPEPESARHRLQ